MMTEDQIERVVERRIDAIDKRYLAGEWTEEEYREKIREVDEWAKRQSAAAPFVDISHEDGIRYPITVRVF